MFSDGTIDGSDLLPQVRDKCIKIPYVVPDVSIHGDTGITIPPGDEEELYQAIRRLGEDPKLRAKYGRAAYERVRTHYTRDVMADITRQVFEELVGK